jgi:hypothetical protein
MRLAELEEVQMPPGARQSVMNRLIGRTTGRASQPLGRVVDLEGDDAFGRTEVDADHAPRRAEPESLSEEDFHQRSVAASCEQGKSGGSRPHRTRENPIFYQVFRACGVSRDSRRLSRSLKGFYRET